MLSLHTVPFILVEPNNFKAKFSLDHFIFLLLLELHFKLYDT